MSRTRTLAAHLRTLPARAILAGLAIKLVVWLAEQAMGRAPTALAVVDTFGGLSVAAGLVYYAFKLVALAQRRLLWKVRRKLILSYIFMGFVPALLIIAFFLLCGFLLFYNFSSYLVQSRLRALSESARVIAQSTVLEIQRGGGQDIAATLARRQETAAEQFPNVSMAVIPADRTCDDAGRARSQGAGGTNVRLQPSDVRLAGPWRHVPAPRTLPAWVGCTGFSGVLAYEHRRDAGAEDRDTHLIARAVVFPDARRPGYAVVVDLLVTDAVKQQLQRETGVEMKNVTTAASDRAGDAKPMSGPDGGPDEPPVPAAAAGILSRLPSPLEYRDWSTGASGTLTITTALSVRELYDRISAAEGNVGRALGQALLLFLFVIGALFLIIQVIALIAGLTLAKSITGSVHELFAGTERVRQGDFTHKITVRSQDQLGELSESFNTMTDSIEELLLQAAEKKRLEEELRIAHEIQMSLLPQGPLTMAGLSVSALCVPAREVGGDYYDFLPLDDHRVGVLIADVSGKGTSAALYMAELKGLVLSLSEIHSSPRDLLIAANRIIANHLDARSFITMTYAVIDVRDRTMTYARAGHTPLIYAPGPGAGSRRVQILAPDGMVVGLKLDQGEMFERLLVEETLDLNAGDLCLFFTDGISEAMNVHDDCFGEARLGQLVEDHAHLPSHELRERMLREIAAFVGEAPQHDDMTMILLKVDGEGVFSSTMNAEIAEITESR
ncbi:MAG: SpoIIE family protein phosphatase [Acidobacteria bacterium]|nr:SpoIIE family protein phosphatase [Acidobacteriota bacterium]